MYYQTWYKHQSSSYYIFFFFYRCFFKCIQNIKCNHGSIYTAYAVSITRGSIPAKVGFWAGLRMVSYVRTPTKLTNEISKTQLLGPKKGGFSPKIPRMWPFFCIWRVLAVFSGLKPAEWALHNFFVSLMLQIWEKKLPQELGKYNLTVSLTKSASIGYFPAFFAFICRYVMQFVLGYFRNK